MSDVDRLAGMLADAWHTEHPNDGPARCRLFAHDTRLVLNVLEDLGLNVPDPAAAERYLRAKLIDPRC